MKKIVFAITALILSVFMLSGCKGDPLISTEKLRYPYRITVTADDVDNNLREFLGISDLNTAGNLGNRAPSSESERAAAKRLYDKYSSDEYSALEVSLDEFEFTVSGETYTSQNVVARFRGKTSDGQQIIIGTSYDNGYGTIDEEYTGNEASTGAYTATGVAAVMSMIDACVFSDFEFSPAVLYDKDVVFVFFGCGVYNSYGAEYYVKSMNQYERTHTELMVNLGNFGGERLYLYCDEVNTKQEDSFRYYASVRDLMLYGLPATMPIIGDASYIDGINYVHYGMLSDHAVFMGAGIPSAYIFSGYYGGFNLSEIEKRGESNVSGTKNDTYDNLINKRADYSEQARDVANLLMNGFIYMNYVTDDPNFLPFRGSSYADYKTWLNPLWAQLTVIFIVIALCVVLIVLVKYFEKKHPFVPVVKRMKIAVFGMDYEEKSDADIFIDIKKPRNPFDGY